MLPFELWLDNIDTLHIFKMLCCTNKEVRKYLVLLYSNHAVERGALSGGFFYFYSTLASSKSPRSPPR